MEIIKKIRELRWSAKSVAALNKEDRANMMEAYNKRADYYTPRIPNFKANLKDLQRCALCPDLCGFDAPCLLLSKDNTFSPQNKSRVGYFVGMNMLPMDNPSVISTFYSCMNCDACKQWCPMDISAGELMTQMRGELEKRNLIPDNITHLKTRIQQNGSIFEKSPFTAESAKEFNIDMPKAKIMYYIGCMSAENRKSMVRANIAILRHLGVSFTTKIEQRVCCGSPLNKVGYKSVAQDLAKKNQALVKTSKVQLLLTDCPACMDALQNTYTEWGTKIKTPIRHFKDYILEQIDKGKLKPQKAINKVVTYHDPCIFARGMGDVESARTLLGKLPGVKVEEAYLHGEETRCCGYGGGYHVTNTELSDKEGLLRLEQLRKHNPDYILSACPTCEYSLAEAQKGSSEKGHQDEVKDLSELVAESLNLVF